MSSQSITPLQNRGSGNSRPAAEPTEDQPGCGAMCGDDHVVNSIRALRDLAAPRATTSRVDEPPARPPYRFYDPMPSEK